MSKEEFACKGSFLFMHKGKPDDHDCHQAALFAKQMIQKAEN